MPLGRAFSGLAIILSCAVGCKRDMPTALDRVRPFDSLRSVSLGMTAGELVATRPSVQIRGYEGYGESIAGYGVSFLFPGSYSENQAVPNHSRLRAIQARRTFDSDSAADSFWVQTIRTVGAESGSPDCGRWVGTDAPGRVAVWRQNWGTTFLTASLWGSYTRPGTNEVARPYVSVTWSNTKHFSFGGDSTEKPILVREECQ